MSDTERYINMAERNGLHVNSEQVEHILEKSFEYNMLNPNHVMDRAISRTCDLSVNGIAYISDVQLNGTLSIPDGEHINHSRHIEQPDTPTYSEIVINRMFGNIAPY